MLLLLGTYAEIFASGATQAIETGNMTISLKFIVLRERYKTLVDALFHIGLYGNAIPPVVANILRISKENSNEINKQD